MLPDTPPIIVLGANHAGTRLVVDILQAMGSDAGHIDNVWREESDFLALHRQLINEVSDAGWDATIFDSDFLAAFEDDRRFVARIETWRQGDAGSGFDVDSVAWHWKCPTAILFLPTWLQVFPDARFIHVQRDAVDVAASLLRRREVPTIAAGVRLDEIMNERVETQVTQMRRYFHLRFEDIRERLGDLASAAGLLPNAEQIEAAAALIRPGRIFRWNRNRSLSSNAWEQVVAARSRLYRLARGR